ncbi:MAG: twin-arginine translocase subunit TatC [bacterium]|jgi:sec-independent protein translocase protein TatC
MDSPEIEKTGGETGCWQEMKPHLVELRNRILATIAFFALAFAAGFYYAEFIFDLLVYPLPEGLRLNYFGVAEAFFTDVKLAAAAALIVSTPVFLFHVWRFVEPGLKRHEKRIILSTVPWAMFLFVAGGVFTYFAVAPAGLKILLGWGADRYDPVLSVGRYTSFLIGLLLAGALLFELPVVLVGLAKLGFVTRASLIKHSRTAVVLILILAAVLTPSPDAFTMLVLSGPIILLYFLSVLFVGFVKPAGE